MKAILFLILFSPVFASAAVSHPCEHELNATTMQLLLRWTTVPMWNVVSNRQMKIGNEGLVQIVQLITVNLGSADVRHAHYFLVSATCDVSSNSLYVDDSDDASDRVTLKHITQDRN